MGMYTSFRFQAIIKAEYIDAIKLLYQLHGQVESEVLWKAVFIKFPKIEIASFAEDVRACMIPFGTDCSERYYFEANNTGLFNNVWQFECELKDYENTICHFMQSIVKLIAEKVICAKQKYENDDEWSDINV